MYIRTNGLPPDELMHYGRKGMKWGEHIYTKDDIRRLKKFMRTKDAKRYQNEFREWDKAQWEKAGYKQGVFRNHLKPGAKLSRFTASSNEKGNKRAYMFSTNTADDGQYKDMALGNNLGNKGKDLYKDTYVTTKKIYVAKGEKIANDIIKKYGDKDFKELWKMYKDLNVHDKSGYIYSYADETYGEAASKGLATKQQISDAEAMFRFKQEVGNRLNTLLYKNDEVKSVIDEKYKKKGYGGIEDAEDWSYGVAHPYIMYDTEKQMKKKSSRKIR